MMDENSNRSKGKIHHHFHQEFWQIGSEVQERSQINYTRKEVILALMY